MLLSALFALALAEPRTIAVELPQAPPRIIVVTDEAPNGDWEPKTPAFPTVTLRLPVDARGDLVRPADARELVELLHGSLEEKYLEAIVWEYGFRRVGRTDRPNLAYLDDLRFADLYYFVGRIWSLLDPGTRLGREISCMSPGEGSLLPIVLLVVYEELISRDYERRPDIPPDFSVFTTMGLSDRLLSLCERRD